jgi:hypothetical protein
MCDSHVLFGHSYTFFPFPGLHFIDGQCHTMYSWVYVGWKKKKCHIMYLWVYVRRKTNFVLWKTQLFCGVMRRFINLHAQKGYKKPSGGWINHKRWPWSSLTILLARLCASLLQCLFSILNSKTSKLDKAAVISCITWAYVPSVPWFRLATTLRQSLATITLQSPTSRARSTASRQAIASSISASVFPRKTLAEAPINSF